MEVRIMTSGRKFAGILGLGLCVVLALAGVAFSQEKAEETAPAKPANEFEGSVKVGLGQYFYLPTAQGYDIAVQGQIEGGDASKLTGKDVRVKGELLLDKPSVFRADSIEVKQGGSYRNVFTRTADLVLPDYVDPVTRESYSALEITSALKNEEWEGKGKVRVYGSIQAGEGVSTILLVDAEGKEIGTIIVDKFTDYAAYYLKKLRLFDKFWFYLDVKDTVDKKVRAKSRELFHADIFLCGLY
jgi:hypothetical protein